VPFAEDDESIDETLRGKTLSYSVTLKGLKERDLLPLERISLAAQTSEQPKQAEEFARSDYVRGMLQSELFERQLTDRLVEIATEGRGAVVNAWTPPVTESSDSSPAGDETVAGDEDGSAGDADNESTRRDDA
jgi:hypothetical protein